MNIDGLKQSSFLTKNDLERPILVTIRSVHQENVAKQGAPEELKWCLEFDETDKPMVLNNTNGQIIAAITGSKETDNWKGHRIVLYHEPNITFGGKLVGGIRARAPKFQQQNGRQVQPAPAPAPPPPPAPIPMAAADLDDVPF